MLELDLSRHCIETAIRRRHDAAVRTYFRQASERPRLEEEITLLLEALETLDFSALRSLHPAMAGSTEARVVLSQKPGGPLAILIDGRPLQDLPQRKTPQRS